MKEPDIVLLYVESPEASADFYAGLLGRNAAQSSPTFAIFPLENGWRLGLWGRKGVEPPVTVPAGGSEIGFTVADKSAVDALYADWTGRGVRIAQERTEMDFGYTFVGLDLDGHRLRVFSLSA